MNNGYVLPLCESTQVGPNLHHLFKELKGTQEICSVSLARLVLVRAAQARRSKLWGIGSWSVGI